MSKYKKLITIPIVIIVVSIYLIGANMLNRLDRVYDLKDALPASAIVKTEEQEDKELEIIGDKININTATESELMMLDGIGSAMAQRIIQKREELGSFSSIEDILDVEGIGTKTFEKLKDYIKTEN